MNEKYMAGFLDADGCISVRARIGARPDLVVEVAQKAYGRAPLDYAEEQFGGVIRVREIGGKQYCSWSARGIHARKCAERLKKYLVLKRHHAEQYLELVDSSLVLHTEQDVKRVREQVKAIRGYGAYRIPNYPARKWLAGYFDGDGSFVVGVCSKTGYAYPKASILAAKNYVAGIVLLQQAFGGKIQAGGQNAVWNIHLSQPSKVKQFVGYFAQHLYLKKAQAYFLLGCAEHGNLRDGEAIRQQMQYLNAQQHRLSDSASVAHDMLLAVNFEVSPRPQGRPRGVVETRPRMKRQSNL